MSKETEAKPGDVRKKRGDGRSRAASAVPGGRAKAAPARRRSGPVGRWTRSVGKTLTEAETTQRFVAASMRFLFKWARAVGRVRASRIAGRVARVVGPLARENRVGRANLAAAFPEKSAAERRAILSGVWDHLARTTIEYAFLPDLIAAFEPDRPTGGLIEHAGIEHAFALRDGGKPGIIFGAHIGNWELTAAIGAKIGLPVTALYRPPANRFVAEEIETLRGTFIGKLVVSGPGAAMQIASALQKGKHIGIIVDQRINDGPRIRFFGRRSPSNPIIGIMARLFDCPVHGARTIRLPDGRFQLEMTPALEFPRDAKGRVDADAANRMVHGIVEGWVREAPEQWLWLHDRWRMRKRPGGPRRRKRVPATI